MVYRYRDEDRLRRSAHSPGVQVPDGRVPGGRVPGVHGPGVHGPGVHGPDGEHTGGPGSAPGPGFTRKSGTAEDPTSAERIRAAAIELYGSHGFSAVTLKEIAEAAGVSTPLVIHHFGSKAGLRKECDRHVTAEVMRMKTETVQRGRLPRNHVMEMIYTSRPVMLYLFRAFATGGEETDKLFDQLVEDSLSYTDEAEQLGLVYPSENPRRRAVVLLLQSFGTLLLHRQLKRHLGVDPVEGPPEDIAPYMAAVVELHMQPVLNAEVYQNLMDTDLFTDAGRPTDTAQSTDTGRPTEDTHTTAPENTHPQEGTDP